MPTRSIPTRKRKRRRKKSGSKAGRPKGSKTGGNIDFDRIGVVDHSIGTSVAGGNPRTFFKVETVPAKCIVHRYKVYDDSLGKSCENVVKELPDQFGDSFLTPSLGAYIVTRKFLYGVPLYRLESILGDAGVGISRVQLADYCIRVADELAPISNRIADDFVHSQERAKVRHADETTLKVVRNSRKSGRTCRMFVYTSCKWDRRLSAVYRFCIDRKAENIISFFVDYSGVVVCDDYSGYDTLAGESNTGKMLVPLAEAFRGDRAPRREIGSVGRKEEGGSVEIICGGSPEEDAKALRNREGTCRRHCGRPSQGKKGTVEAYRG